MKTIENKIKINHSTHTNLDKKYILGRKEKNPEGLLNIGRYYALDSSLGSHVYLDALKPHVTLICGKRGYGKSYTMGVILEEISRLEEKIRKNLSLIVIDTLGIFWTSNYPNNEKEILKKWNIKSEKTKINLFTPKKVVKDYEEKNIKTNVFSIKTSDLSSFHWLKLFKLNYTKPLGIAITRVIQDLKEKNTDYSIDMIIDLIKKDEKNDRIIINAAENLFKMADEWEIFKKKGLNLDKIVIPGEVSILDLSHIKDDSIKNIITSILSEKIFEERVKARKNYEIKKMSNKKQEKNMPLVWMAVDEAQIFLPKDEETSCKKVLINQWMRQGRQPGLSLILATQRPSALDQEVLSHSDIIICHRLTSQNDIDSLSRIRPTYMYNSIEEMVKKIGEEKGLAFIVDDNSESTHLVKIRPRYSWHGGDEPYANKN